MLVSGSTVFQCRQSYGPDNKGAFYWFLGLRSCPMLTFLRSFLAFVVEGGRFLVSAQCRQSYGPDNNKSRSSAQTNVFTAVLPVACLSKGATQASDSRLGTCASIIYRCARTLSHVRNSSRCLSRLQFRRHRNHGTPTLSLRTKLWLPKTTSQNHSQNCLSVMFVRCGGRLGLKNWLKKPVTKPLMPKPTSCCSKLRATVGLRPR